MEAFPVALSFLGGQLVLLAIVLAMRHIFRREPDFKSRLREVKDVSLRRLRNVSENERGRIIEVLGMRWSLRKILRCGILSARMYAEPLAAAVAQ